MAWRAIQDTVGVSLSLAELDDQAERVWWRILAHTDPWGRLDARPGKVRALCFPLLTHITDQDCGKALLSLEHADRIVVWEHRGQVIIQIVDFEQRQPREAFRKRPPASEFPDPPANLKPTQGLVERLYNLNPDTFRNRSGNQNVNHEIAGISGTTPDTFRTPSGGDGEERRRRGDGEQDQQEPHHQHAAREPDDDLSLRLQTHGLRGRALTAANELLTNDPARLEACIAAALERGTSSTSYLAELVLNGSHPEGAKSHKPERSTLAAGAVGTRSTSPPLPNRPRDPEPEPAPPPDSFLALTKRTTSEPPAPPRARAEPTPKGTPNDL